MTWSRSRSAVRYSTSSVTWPSTTLAVRGLDEAVRVDAAEGCQGADQTDVRAFRRLDRAHTAVVGRCGRRAPRWPARSRDRPPGPSAERRRLCVTPDGEVGLVHELGELGGAEELLDGGVHDRTDVHQGLRGDGSSGVLQWSYARAPRAPYGSDRCGAGSESARRPWRMRRLPKWSISSTSTRRSTSSPLRLPGKVAAPACRATRYLIVAMMSSSVRVEHR